VARSNARVEIQITYDDGSTWNRRFQTAADQGPVLAHFFGRERKFASNLLSKSNSALRESMARAAARNPNAVNSYAGVELYSVVTQIPRHNRTALRDNTEFIDYEKLIRDAEQSTRILLGTFDPAANTY
jgi:hypothetical protein